MIISLTPFLITLGLSLFVLRSQLLRVAIREQGTDNLHRSNALGAASGWASLFGAVALIAAAFMLQGLVYGAVIVVVGIALGILVSAMFLPTLGNTLAMGMHGGEGDKSVAEFNRRYGHVIAFAVAGIALLCLYSIFTIRL